MTTDKEILDKLHKQTNGLIDIIGECKKGKSSKWLQTDHQVSYIYKLEDGRKITLIIQGKN